MHSLPTGGRKLCYVTHFDASLMNNTHYLKFLHNFYSETVFILKTRIL